MSVERWRDVVGYERMYQVSDLGRVMRVEQRDADGRAVRKAKLLQASPHYTSRRMGVGLRKDGVTKKVYVDRVVLAAWIGPIKAGQVVLHGPLGVANNSVGNLSYGSRDKCKRKPHHGARVRRSDGKEFISMASAAREVGVGESRIWLVCNSRSKRAGGWGWEYCDQARMTLPIITTCVVPFTHSETAQSVLPTRPERALMEVGGL